MNIRRTAQLHIAEILAANGGAWPESTAGYVRLAWKIGGLSCVPSRRTAKAQLVPDAG